MDGIFVQSMMSPGAEPRLVWGSFQCNGTSNPDPTKFRYPPGCKFTCAYSATGVFTLGLPPGLGTPGQPSAVLVSAECATVGTAFEAVQLAETTLNAATRTLVIQAKQGTTGFAPTNVAGNRIHFAILFNNSTGA